MRRRSLKKSATVGDLRQTQRRASLNTLTPTRRTIITKLPARALSILKNTAPTPNFSKAFRSLTPTFAEQRQRRRSRSLRKNACKNRSATAARDESEGAASDSDDSFLNSQKWANLHGNTAGSFTSADGRSSRRARSMSDVLLGGRQSTPDPILPPSPTASGLPVRTIRHTASVILKNDSLVRRQRLDHIPPLVRSERASLDNMRVCTAPQSFKTRRALSMQDFAILGSLGRGAFGKVLLAYLKPSKRNYVAIKGISKRKIVRRVETVLQEVANLKQSLRHPFILTLYAVLQDANMVYIVTEYLAGGSLEHLLKHFRRWTDKKKRLNMGKGHAKEYTPGVPLKLVCFYTAQLTQALGFLHANQIIYNDLKLENVLVQMDGYCKLIDLGLSYRVLSKEDSLPVCGTPANMAPEVVRTGASSGSRANGFDKAVDWWALGVLMYHLYFGVHPFDRGDGMKASFIRILNGDLQFPPHLSSDSMRNKELSKAAIRDLIKRLLCVDTAKRLGNGDAGTKAVMSHPFFNELLPGTNDTTQPTMEVMWVQLEKKLIRTPFLPQEHRPDNSDKSFVFGAKEGHRKINGKDKKNTRTENKVGAAAAESGLTPKQQAEFNRQLTYFVNESWFRA